LELLHTNGPPRADAPEWYQRRHNGLAADDAWVQHLLCDDEWPAEDEAVLRSRHRIHEDAVGALAEARWYGSVFLAQVVEGFAAGPGQRGTQAEICLAAACYAAEHDLMWEVWELASGIGNPEAHLATADPAMRRTMVDIVLQARDQDTRAADHIERVLEIQGNERCPAQAAPGAQPLGIWTAPSCRAP
jgi:hypothetical protein